MTHIKVARYPVAEIEKIMESLAEGHRRCDLLLAAAEEALEAGNWAAFRVHVMECRGALLALFTIEEEIVFPQYECRTGLRDATAQLRMQHGRIRETLDMLASVSPAHDPAGCRAEFSTLALLYRQHRRVEEDGMGPAFSRAPDAPLTAPAAPAFAPPLDLRGLEPPQPIVRIFEALKQVRQEPLRVVLPHEPFPLYGLLREQGFEWSGAPRPDGGFELTIRPARQ